VTTAADVLAYRGAIDDLSARAVVDLNDVLAFVAGFNPVETRNALIRLLPEVISPYLTASGELAATWYEDLRAEALSGSYMAVPTSGEPSGQKIKATARWAVAPLFGKSDSTVLSLLGGSVQRMIADEGRATIENNTIRDKARVGWARIPQPGCCKFCSMLASRGVVYGNSKSAGGEGRKYHDYDRCVAAPVFAGDTFLKPIVELHTAAYLAA
jgi:hypothetical protein